jgi:hypothetical protein
MSVETVVVVMVMQLAMAVITVATTVMACWRR